MKKLLQGLRQRGKPQFWTDFGVIIADCRYDSVVAG
jgi:hypothetical protein